MPYLAFDIETVANDRAEQYFASKQYTPDQQLLDPEGELPTKIQEIKTPELKSQRATEWREQQRLKVQQSILQKRQKDYDAAALYWWTGKVVCISYIDHHGQDEVMFDDSEERLLRYFFTTLTTRFEHSTLIGKSSLDFDIPFLIGRALAHNLGIPKHLRMQDFGVQIRDINRIFSFSTNCSQVTSLENYAFGLGIEGKKGKGNQVKDWYNLATTGDKSAWNKIADYCVHDSKIVREMLTRWEKPFTPDERFNTEAPVAKDPIPF